MKIIAYYETPAVGSYREFEVEIDDEDLEDLTEEEREEFINSAVEYEIANYVWTGWKEA